MIGNASDDKREDGLEFARTVQKFIHRLGWACMKFDIEVPDPHFFIMFAKSEAVTCKSIVKELRQAGLSAFTLHDLYKRKAWPPM